MKVTLLRGKSRILNRGRGAPAMTVPAVSDAPTAPAWPSIPAMLAATEQHHGALPAVRDGETTLTYTALTGAARRFGAALVASGVEPGDRVALWCFNCAEWIVA